jgi:hypothetical protein
MDGDRRRADPLAQVNALFGNLAAKAVAAPVRVHRELAESGPSLWQAPSLVAGVGIEQGTAGDPAVELSDQSLCVVQVAGDVAQLRDIGIEDGRRYRAAILVVSRHDQSLDLGDLVLCCGSDHAIDIRHHQLHSCFWLILF